MNFFVLDYCSINAGDWIQSLATMQFMDEIAGTIERDSGRVNRSSEYSADLVRHSSLIFNGWVNTKYARSDFEYIRDFKNSLVLSANLQPECYPELPSVFKTECVGLRDLTTFNRLLAFNPNCYFSGCMTTLIKKPDGIHKIKGKVIINELDRLFYGDGPAAKAGKDALNLQKTSLYIEKKNQELLSKLEPLISADILEAAIFFDHDIYEMREDSFQNAASIAKSILLEYATAELVITSRLHCALPCLALGTPVIFIWNKNDPRMSGLIQLFEGFIDKNDFLSGKVKIDSTIAAGSNEQYLGIIQTSLIYRLKSFIESSGGKYVYKSFDNVLI